MNTASLVRILRAAGLDPQPHPWADLSVVSLGDRAEVRARHDRHSDADAALDVALDRLTAAGFTVHEAAAPHTLTVTRAAH